MNLQGGRAPLGIALGAILLTFWPGVLDSFAAPKAAVARILGSVLLVTWTSRVAHGRWRFSALDVCVLAWLGSSILSTVFSVSPRISILGEVLLREGLLTSFGMAGLYFAARLSGVDGTKTTAWTGFRIALAITAAYGLVQWLGWDPLQWDRTASYPTGSGRVLRPFSTLGNPILLGQVMALGLVMEVARLREQDRGRGWSVGLALLFAAVLMGTLSRGPWIAAGLGLIVALWRIGPREHRSAASGRWIWVALAAGMLGMVAFSASRMPIMERLTEFARPGTVSSHNRIDITRSAWAAGMSRPLLGWGLDTFAVVFPRFQTAGYGQTEASHPPAHAHSAPLQVFATRGLLGLLTALGVIGVLLWNLFRRSERADPEIAAHRAGVITLLVASLTNPLGITATAVLAVLAGFANASQEPALTPDRSRPGAAWDPGTMSALVVGIALTIASARELVGLREAWLAMRLFNQSMHTEQAVVRDGLLEAARLAQRASTAPGAGDGPLRLEVSALLAESRVAASESEACSLLTRATAVASAAVQLEPLRCENHQWLGDAWAGRTNSGCEPGDWPRAEAAYARSRELAPRDPWIRLAEARSRVEHGDLKGAHRLGDDLSALYPREPWGDLVHASAWEAEGREVEAEAALERAHRAGWQPDPSASPNNSSSR